MISAHPLCWPSGWKRTPNHQRKRAAFNKSERVTVGESSYMKGKQLSVADGLNRVLLEMQRLGVSRDDVIISTNVPTRLDGLPRSDQSNPSDPGVAVYWKTRQSEPVRCMPMDQYDRVADNLAAVAATLEAMRAIRRHGGAEILDRAFTGFAALPESTERRWREVLGLIASCSLETVEARYRELARKLHPDAGGSEAAMSELNRARDEARAELGAKSA